MNASAILFQGTVIDLDAIPWTALGIAFAVFYTVLEVRLAKAGFVKQPAVDTLATKLEGCIGAKEVNAMAARIDDKIAQGARDLDVTSRMVLVVRTDLDETRDRVTRTEGQHEALNTRLVDSLKPLPGIAADVRSVLLNQERLTAEVENLKRTRGNGGG